MKELKVAFVCHWPPGTGIGRIIYSLFESILENRPDIHPTMFSIYPTDLEGLSIEARRNTRILSPIPFKPSSFNVGGNLNRIFTLLFASHLIPRNYDIYHISDHMIGMYAGQLKPSVVMATDVSQCKVHSIDQIPIPALYNALLSINMNSVRKADGVMAISKFGMNDVATTLGIPRRKFGIVYPGIDHQIFYPRDKHRSRASLGLPQDKKIILHVGTEIPTKNVPTVLRAFARMKKKHPDLLLVRVGRPLPSTLSLIRQLDLEDAVKYYLHLTDIPLASAYSSADVFVFPSSYEGFGLPPVEAMASGCPTIVGSCETMHEVVSDGGLFVNPTDDEDLANTTLKLLENPSAAKDLSERGRKRSEYFDWKKSVDSLVDFYHDVMNNRNY